MNTMNQLDDQILYQATHAPIGMENHGRSLFASIERRALTPSFPQPEVIEFVDEATWALWLDANLEALLQAYSREYDFWGLKSWSH